jgi:hypothetical protein
MKKYEYLLIAILLPFSIIFCQSREKSEQKNVSYKIQDVEKKSWEELSHKRIFFGHRSVGNNIISGMKDILKENKNISLKIVETETPINISGGVFAHAPIGENSYPYSKLTHFSKIMDNGVANNVNMAFFKFCFVDIKSKTDVEKLFSDYKTIMDRLKQKYPETKIVHLTVPLTESKAGFKTWIKVLIGKKDIWEYDDIVRKNEFNDMLRKTYGGKDLIFDIAEIESIKPDGSRETFKRKDRIYNALAPEYSRDGGHLNALGSKVVAEQLLLFLVNNF